MNTISATLLYEHPIEGCIKDANGNLKPFPILAIDNIPLNIWMHQNARIIDEMNDLVPAQGWLYDHDSELALSNAWKLLKPQAYENVSISTVVPILICSDDLDLVCNVVMVEQVVSENQVAWARFGYAFNHIHDVVTSVVWETSPSAPRLSFSLSEFEKAYNDLKELDKKWSEGFI
ncbi:TPA: hypothetical protein JIZ13_01920 [Acinetobacter nosocomialis]|uniref:hypothetical protein n=1 Tax=Acinetobacter nosocomialis TaxID=106654 RepID=UPI0009E12F68|nr:hypothetical protein [Acinetobacter nosocomialis]ARG16873.1 hypothetical protein B7L44_09905 [Acinetobacter nosocomialis]MBP1470529.1 hypothetical protein [Acinetobacter nosocomialis]MBR7692720.1 hypothetical protein [Acinetobacter nosocomialis]SSR76379.1 Uncharacterised protein [Acinetobacter nosocomialis]HAV4988099.1 hypothetical protein [Acinetobacter nosocomialis]